jgi:hypothetical protein
MEIKITQNHVRVTVIMTVTEMTPYVKDIIEFEITIITYTDGKYLVINL